MISTFCILRATEYVEDEIGVSKEQITEKKIPIIRIEKVYAKEFYQACEVGIKPNLRIIVSSNSYHDEPELQYLDTIYSVTRVQDNGTDETILICSRKVKNV